MRRFVNVLSVLKRIIVLALDPELDVISLGEYFTLLGMAKEFDMCPIARRDAVRWLQKKLASNHLLAYGPPGATEVLLANRSD